MTDLYGGFATNKIVFSIFLFPNLLTIVLYTRGISGFTCIPEYSMGGTVYRYTKPMLDEFIGKLQLLTSRKRNEIPCFERTGSKYHRLL